MNIFKRALIRYILHRHAIPHQLWLDITDKLYILQGMTAVDKAHLRALSTLFLHEKNIVAVQGLQLTDAMRVIIAVQACLPVLKIGLDRLSGWTDIIVYPGPFRVSRDEVDPAGVVHRRDHVLSGESWSRGPIVLSWQDVEGDMQQYHAGRNVVIHEIAHKLDVLNGSTNGYPPLHHDMSISHWTEVLSTAYGHLSFSLENQQPSFIDPYAASSPAEFFSVSSEYFFCSPEILFRHFAEVYQQLQLYYRQNPLLRQQADVE